LRWSQEYTSAKEAEIAAKNAQLQTLEREITSLRELTPMKIREYFLSVKGQLEEYNTLLQQQLEETRLELSSRDVRIQDLTRTEVEQRDEISRNVSEKRELEVRLAYLDRQASVLAPVYDNLILASGTVNAFSETYPNALETFANIDPAKELGLAFGTPDYESIQKIKGAMANARAKRLRDTEEFISHITLLDEKKQ